MKLAMIVFGSFLLLGFSCYSAAEHPLGPSFHYILGNVPCAKTLVAHSTDMGRVKGRYGPKLIKFRYSVEERCGGMLIGPQCRYLTQREYQDFQVHFIRAVCFRGFYKTARPLPGH